MKEYARQDNRILIIDKKNSGYGDSMNCGFDAAEGEYLGIVEPDDYAELDMFRQLYKSAVKYNLDVCKAGFFEYSTTPEIRNTPVLSSVKLAGKNVFCPTRDFKSPQKQAAFFSAILAIWAGIYRKSFIRDNHIWFNPTPGASYQDVGFCFKVWSKAQRVLMLDCCLLHYRIDNCEKDTGFAHIVCAKSPVPLMKHSLASPSSVAYIMAKKYADGLSLAKQEEYGPGKV